ncbi:MAG: hypothetical protein LBQ42_03155 [Synergistaceae bacterium]|jgi:hypothetical protein|nr:hypothetical protein [Synergistaceae bacterium]
MLFETFEKQSFDDIQTEVSKKLTAWHRELSGNNSKQLDSFQNIRNDVARNFAGWLGLHSPENVQAAKPGFFETAKTMYKGGTDINGNKTLGLLEISKRKINPEFREQNIKQQSGWAAEVISTAKENMQAKIDGTGITTVRADDLPELFKKNDQYVDKVRLNANGEIIERIQTKFVGKNAEECFSKLTSGKYAKYFTDGKVDKIEIPGNYFDKVKSELIPARIENLERQLERVLADGKIDVAEKIQSKIARCKQIDTMVEECLVSTSEARDAALHPKSYTTKLFLKESLSGSHSEGVKSGLTAATVTAAISIVDNVRSVIRGDITPQEAFTDVAKDTGTAAAIGYGVSFVSSAVARAMSESGHTLIKSLGKTGVPATAIAFGISSYDSVVDYAQGEISGEKLAYVLGENAAGVAGSVAGSVLTGAAVGSVAGPVGTVAGVAAGLVGGMVGYAVATGAYATAIEVVTGGIDVLADKVEAIAASTVDFVTKDVPEAYATTVEVVNEGANALRDKAEEMARSVLNLVENNIPDKVEYVKSAMNDFAANLGLPIHL